MANNKPISKFFNEDYIAFASYDGTRKIASCIDGLKPTARKVVFTMLDLNIVEPKKVDSIKAKVADHTEYIHGQDTIEGVIVNLAQDYVGACNIPLLIREGNFGYRLMPNASASRYIKTAQESYLKLLFRKDDNAVIGQQEFEGTKIEPQYYVPVVPMLLVNGAEGIAVGYAQKILPRNPQNLMKFIFGGMKDESLLLPWFKGFKGKVIQTDAQSFEMRGIIECVNTTTYEITEVPVGYNYNSYLKVLQGMQEANQITGYDDFCDLDKDIFKFTVRVRRETHKKLSELGEVEVLQYFKLIKRVTENYTCLNEHNQIEVFDSAKAIVERYARVRIGAYKIRKELVEKEMLAKIWQLKSKIIFIQHVREGKINIKEWSKQTILQHLEAEKDIVEHNSSYDYLLNMPLWSINIEALNKAAEEAKKTAEEYEKYRNTEIATLWKNEFNELAKKI